MYKKACKQFAEDRQTKDKDETKINLFDSDGVKRMWQQPGKEYKDWYCLVCLQVRGISFHVRSYCSGTE